jgi:hypothetical protein
MRALLILPALVFAGSLDATPAPAAPVYPWCACSFDTFRQCLETLSGIGGVCIDNPSYPGPGSPLAQSSPRR